MKKSILIFCFIWGCVTAPPIRINTEGVQTPTSLGTNTDNDVATISVSAITPVGNSLIVALLAHSNGTVRTHNLASDDWTGSGSWTAEASQTSTNCRISLNWVIVGPNPGSGAVTQTMSAGCLRVSFAIVEITGFDRGTVFRENLVGNNTSSTASLGFTDLINGTLPFGAIVSQADTDGITPGSGETELLEVSPGGSFESRLQVQYGDGTEDVTFNWSALNTGGNAFIAVEVNSDPGIVDSKLKFRVLGVASR